MKKLLGILASVGLMATTSVSVVACGSNKPDPTPKTKKAVAPKEALPIELKETHKEEVLTESDQELVKTEIFKALNDANKDAVIESDTFTVNLTDVKPEVASISVEVKATKGNETKLGLEAGNVDVKLAMTAFEEEAPKTKKAVAPKEALPIELKETHKEEVLTESDQELVKTEIIKALNDANKDAVIESDTFTVNLTDVKPEVASISVEVKATKENETKLGLEAGNVDVKLAMTAATVGNKFEEVVEKIKSGVNVNLSDFKIDLGNALPFPVEKIGDIFGLVGMATQILNLPEQIPTNFDDNDSNWVQWQNSVDTLRELLKDSIDIDEEISLGHVDQGQDGIKFPIPEMDKDLYITIDAKISDVLNAILPDLIHFRNFMLEQSETNQNENFLLLLIQYLFDEPRDINEDGFKDINQNIENFEPKTNLENLIYDIIEGWENTNKEILVKEPLKIRIGGYLISDTFFNTFAVKYHTKMAGPIPIEIGLIDILPVENIKEFINKLLNHDLNEPLNLTIVLPEINFGDIKIGGEQDIDLGSMFLNNTIKSGLKNILETDEKLEELLDGFEFNWKEGTLKTEILNENDKWVYAALLDDLLIAKDMRVKFEANTIEVKLDDQIVELKDVNIVINLDIDSSIILG